MPPRLTKRHYPTPLERHDRRAHVLALVRAGCSRALTIERAAAELQIDPALAATLYREITAQWARDWEQGSKTARAEAVERVRGDIVRIRKGEVVRKANGAPRMVVQRDAYGRIERRPDGKAKRCMLRRIDETALRQSEKLLAELEGTLAPLESRVEVDVTVRAALLGVVASLGPEQQRELIEEQRELERRAGLAVEPAAGVPRP